LVAVAKLVSAKLLAAGDEAGAKYGMDSQMWMVGHNSNVYDMKVMDCALERLEEKAGGWVSLLEDAGVVGVIDSLSMLGGDFKALAGLGVNGQTGKSLSVVYERVFSGEKLPDAHRAQGDVVGLVRIITTSAAMQACLLGKTVGMRLKSWVQRQQVLANRLTWEKARDARLAQGVV
jgi:hypothetical protein